MNNKQKLRDELKKAKKWAFDNLVGKKVYNKDIDEEVIFTKKGVKHAIYTKKYPLKTHLIYQAVNLLETSTLLSKEKDKKGRKDIKNVYKLLNIFKYNNKEYSIYIVIRETKRGCIYYDHGVIKK
ncbi:MAG: hypothetical protein IIA88_10835 [Bacteroidetes bacterium]|nr:hypothetical protein [Bacteroidota bacterium]